MGYDIKWGVYERVWVSRCRAPGSTASGSRGDPEPGPRARRRQPPAACRQCTVIMMVPLPGTEWPLTVRVTEPQWIRRRPAADPRRAEPESRPGTESKSSGHGPGVSEFESRPGPGLRRRRASGKPYPITNPQFKFMSYPMDMLRTRILP